MWQAAQAARGRRSGGTRAQRVRAALRDPAALLLVAERRRRGRSGVLLAELAARRRRRLLEVVLVAVAPSAQRQGVGTALVRSLTERYPRVRAEVGPGDEAALGPLLAAGLRPADGAGLLGVRLETQPS